MIIYEGASSVIHQAIQLTENQGLSTLTGSNIGRATYYLPMRLWNKKTGILTDFKTHFSFVINPLNNAAYGDGMAFFMGPPGSSIPALLNCGRTLGLASYGEELNSTSNPFVAIEFDTFKNTWDPPYDHVGVDVNSMKSVKNVKWWRNITGGELNEAWISYNSSTKILSVFFTGIVNNATMEQYFDYALDMRLYLPEKCNFGFTGASSATVTPTIYSWNFTSSWKMIIQFLRRIRAKRSERKESFTAQLTEQEFETATGAKMMSHNEMVSATNNFDEKNKLGLVLREGQLLLVFEYMPNLSLDYHLFKGTTLLKWVKRYKIAQGLASALHYLHQGCERCVLHRDIKSSNVLLDSNFNAKLADFGLSRLVSHDAKSQTLEGWTNGYEAPECHQTGKSSKMSDVYSFGVVALEIACGRRAFVQMDDGNHVRLVKWVWDHYEQGDLLDAADKRLCRKFDENQMKLLMMVGLWCAHPDFLNDLRQEKPWKCSSSMLHHLIFHQDFLRQDILLLLLQCHHFHPYNPTFPRIFQQLNPFFNFIELSWLHLQQFL
ncbi:hypothetical protein GH714_000502 [Hevea brasiliensis]|uniref:Protein kinase domain-containing protein n=1 Tax=Hevea brasiliensis TaxID=3981 RepID=A0A6A6N5Y5_HEVBR|nr:hypothetical protein GH714_000502 [Hevea brasiliensis]